MTLSTQSVIEIWSMHLDEYLTQSIKNNTKFSIVYDGVQTLLHVFSILYCRTDSLEDYYTQTQRAYLLYLEYVEKIYKPKSMSFSSVLPAVFVYKRIFESEDMDDTNDVSNTYADTQLDIFLQIRYWTNIFFLHKTIPDPDLIREFLPKLLNKNNPCDKLEKILQETPLTKTLLEDFFSNV